MSTKIEKYLTLFKNDCQAWFAKNGEMVRQNYEFFQQFFRKDNLAKMKWEDVQELGAHVHALNNMALARKRALGNPNHPIEHYRDSLYYLAYGDDDLETRIDNFRSSPEYQILCFGDSVTGELLGNLFADKFVAYNVRDKYALELLQIDPGFVRGDSFAKKYLKFNQAIEPLIEQYEEMIGSQIDVPLNLQIDQFFSYLYERQADSRENAFYFSAEEFGPLLARFLERHPDFIDFSEPGIKFAADELDYKRKILDRFEAELGIQRLQELLSQGQGVEALARVGKLAGNLVQFNSWRVSFGDTDKEITPILQAFLNVAEKEYEGAGTVAEIFDAIETQGLKASWDTLSFVLWLLQPTYYAPIKIRYYRKLAEHLGQTLPTGRPTAKKFEDVMDWMEAFWDALEEYGPQDYTDVQSFIWEMQRLLLAEDKVEEDVSIARTWVVAAGEGAASWEEFYETGLIAIGWTDIGDLREYASKEGIAAKLQSLAPRKGKKTNDALAYHQFAYVVNPGDLVIVKQGKQTVLGLGTVISDYVYNPERDTLPYVREVDWQLTGEWKLPDSLSLPLKTLTEMSSNTELIEFVNSLRSERGDMNQTIAQAWWLNANPNIWNFAEVKVGERQSYTAYNHKGNKRRVFKYFEAIREGDIIVGYVTSPLREVIAICRVTRALHQGEEGLSIEFEKTEQLRIPLSFDAIKSNPGLQQCEVVINNQGSLFKLRSDEYDILRDMIDEANPETEILPARPYTIDQAMDGLFLPSDEFANILDLLRYKQNIILQGPPGVGKSFIAKRLAFRLIGFEDESRVSMVQFHQSYSYEDFIQGYRPGDDGNFKLRNGVFHTACRRAALDRDRPYVFIIDEINRGNLSKILGELMLLIEPDKRGEKFAMPLTYSQNAQETFYIPENLYLIGMMNTADRSLALVDYALRRRFCFVALKPQFTSAGFKSHLAANGADTELIKRIVDLMDSLNKQIREDDNRLGEGYEIGHSFFCPATNGTVVDIQWWRRVIQYEIAPLLREYWFDEPDKARNIISQLMNGMS